MKNQSFEEVQEASEEIHIENSKKEVYQLQQIQSERVTQQIEDDLTALQKKMNRTPLSFYVKIGQSYLFSFKKQEVLLHILKTVGLSIFEISIAVFVWFVLAIPDNFKALIILLVSINLTLFLLLFFIDPGTLFNDEEQQIDTERYFCQMCRLYRYDSTQHCRYCLKCVKGYDHHCSFFGKCIGRRNYLMFILFLLSMSGGGIFSMGSLMYTLLLVN